MRIQLPAFLKVKGSIRTIIIVLFTVQIITVSGVISYLLIDNGQKAVEHVTNQLITEIDSKIDNHLNNFFSVPHTINSLNVSAISQKLLNVNDQEALINHFFSQTKIYKTINSIYFGNLSGGLANAGRDNSNEYFTIKTENFKSGLFEKYRVDYNGKPINLLTTIKFFNAAERPWFINAVKNGFPTWSPVYVLFTGQDMVISASNPVYDANKNVLGVLSVDLFLSQLSGYLKNIRTKNSHSYIIEMDGLLIASSNDTDLYKKDESSGKFIRINAANSNEQFIKESSKAIIKQYKEFSKVKTNANIITQINNIRTHIYISQIRADFAPNWLIITVIPEIGILEQVASDKYRTFALLALAIITAAILAIFAARWITSPILELNTNVKQFTQGKQIPDDPSGWITETVELKRVFREMSIQLKRTIEDLSIEVSERKSAEISLTVSEKKYRELFNFAVGGILIGDLKGVIIDANTAITALTGKDRSYYIGRHITDGVFTRGSLDSKPFRFDLLKEGLTVYTERDMLCRNNSIIPIEMHTKLMPDNTYQSIIHDITKRREAEKALHAEKERLRITLMSIGDGVITTDIEGTITNINKAAEELTGWSRKESEGKELTQIFNIINQKTKQPCENPAAKVLQTGQIIELANHTVLISRNGDEKIIADSAAPIKNEKSETTGVVIVFRDVTEKEKMIDSIHKTDKLESIGYLAAGIAHDFNNLLGGILGFINMARLESTDTKIIKYLDKAIATHERAKDLTHQLITFSKGGIPIKKTGDIGEVLKDCAEFALTGSNVLSRINIDKNLMLCDFDRNQMSQVFDNILINAKQSMPEGGVVTITASNVMIQPDTKPTNDDDLQNTEFIKISIIDSGIGIDKDNLKKIFDPFFTTKLQGTGLGLASSYSIIKNHNGKIEIESEKGKGAAFHIFIPASKNKQLTENIINTISHTGIGKIVIMDDEDFILDIVSEMLKYMGYESEFVKDGDSLLTLITKYHTENISILGVILDLTIPGGKGGKDVIQDIRKLYPNLPVFASSGYSEDPIISKPEDYGFTDSIRKPFLVNELAGMLNKYFKPV